MTENANLSARLHGVVMRFCGVMVDAFTAIGEAVFSAEMADELAQVGWMVLVILTFSVLMTLGVMCGVGLFLSLAA